jgi:hypothetical protein
LATRYSFTAFTDQLVPEAIYVTILRSPMSHFRSAFRYWQIGQSIMQKGYRGTGASGVCVRARASAVFVCACVRAEDLARPRLLAPTIWRLGAAAAGSGNLITPEDFFLTPEQTQKCVATACGLTLCGWLLRA